MLMRALTAAGITARLYSFKRQYPSWLYPGQSDRDSSLEGHREQNTEYLIDSLNPLTWLATARKIANEQPDLVVFHWWTIFWAPCFFVMMSVIRRRGIRIAMICHNLVDHDASAWKRFVSSVLLGRADAYLVHSSQHVEALCKRWPRKPIVHHPIPIYSHYPEPKGSLPPRGRLELLFFGFIRPYKGLDVLLDAVAALGRDDIYLTVVGEYWGDSTQLRTSVANAPNIELHLRYMDDVEAAEYFARADFVVLPYRSATGSAVASVAFHYDKPIIASATGGLIDVIIDGQTGVLVPAGDASALAAAIASVDRTSALAMSAHITTFKQSFNWASLCKQLMSLVDPTTSLGKPAIPYDSNEAPTTTHDGSSLEP